MRVAANMVGQEFLDNPLDESSYYKETSHLGQGDIHAIVAQEMIKWMKNH